MSFQVLKEKYLNRRSASIFLENTPARSVIPVNCAAMIAVPSVARHNPVRRSSALPTTPTSADPTRIGGLLEKCDRLIRRVSSTGVYPGMHRRIGLGDGPKSGAISNNYFLRRRRVAFTWTIDPRKIVRHPVRFLFDEMPQACWPRCRADGQFALRAGGGSKRVA